MRVNRDSVPFYNATVDDTVQQAIATPCYLQTVHVKNNDAAVRYLQIFNLPAASVTLGTTVPTLVLPILASGTEMMDICGGVFMSGGLSFACTTTSGGSTGATVDAMVSAVYSIL